MIALPDSELLVVFKLLYPSMSNLCTGVAASTGMSVSTVMKVILGQRNNVNVDKALVAAFRDKLIELGIGNVI